MSPPPTAPDHTRSNAPIVEKSEQALDELLSDFVRERSPESRHHALQRRGDNRWVSEDSATMELDELRSLEARRSAALTSQANSNLGAPSAAIDEEGAHDTQQIALDLFQEHNTSTIQEHNASTTRDLLRILDQSIAAWQQRLDRLHRFVSLRERAEKWFVSSLVVLAVVASAESQLGDAYTLMLRVMTGLSTALGLVSAVLFVLDPQRQTKFYEARVRKAIAMYQSYKQVLLAVDPSSRSAQQVLVLSQLVREMLEPHREKW